MRYWRSFDSGETKPIKEKAQDSSLEFRGFVWGYPKVFSRLLFLLSVFGAPKSDTLPPPRPAHVTLRKRE